MENELSNPLDVLDQSQGNTNALDVLPEPGTVAVDDDAVKRRAYIFSVGDLPTAEAVSEGDMVDTFNQIMKTNESIIKTSGDIALREQARRDELLKDTSMYAMMAANPTYPTEIQKGAREALAFKLAEEQIAQDQMEAEKRYVTTIQELIAQGDVAQAQMLDTLRRTPTAMEAAIRLNTRQAYMMKAIEDAGITVENRNWFANLVDFAFFFLPLIDSTSKTGNYGSDLVTQRWYDDIWAGERIRSEASAIRAVRDDKEYMKAVDALIPALKKSTNDFGWQNKFQFMMLADQFLTKTDEAYVTNVWNTLDNAAIPGIIAKGVRAPFTMTRTLKAMGARKEAADILVKAAAKADEAGPQVAASEGGLTIDEMEAGFKPKALDPDAPPVLGDPNIGANVTDRVARSKELVEHYIANFSPSQRLNETELATMKKEMKAKAAKDFGRHVEDIDIDNVQLSNGTIVHSPTVIFGTTKKSLFAKKEAAQNFLDGLGIDGASIEEFANANGTMYGVRARLPITESQWYNKFEDVQPRNMFERFFYGGRQTASEDIYGLGERSVAQRQKIMASLSREIGKVMGPMSNEERKVFRMLMIKSEKLQTWLRGNVLGTEYARAVGKLDEPVDFVGTDVTINVPSTGIADPFLEPHTYKAWRELNAAGEEIFPPEHEDLWKALDRKADEALLRETGSEVDARNAFKVMSRLEKVQEARANMPHLDGILDDLRGGVAQQEIARRPDGTRSSTATLYGFPSKKDIRNLIKQAARPNDAEGQATGGVRLLGLPGDRYVAWEGSQDFHTNVYETLNNLLGDRGLPLLEGEKGVRNIFIPVNDKGKAVRVEITDLYRMGWPNSNEEILTLDEFLGRIEDAKYSGPALRKRARDAKTRADRIVSGIGESVDASNKVFRQDVDNMVSLRGIQRMMSNDGGLLQYNKNKLQPATQLDTVDLEADIPERIKRAYAMYVDLNNVEHLLREEDMWMQAHIRGYETVSFDSARGRVERTNGKVYRLSNRTVPRGRVYNITDDLHHIGNDPDALKPGTGMRLTDTDIKKMMEQDYIMVRLERPQDFRGGTKIQWVIGKREDFTVEPLKLEQLGYVEGGHRGYADKWFAKQAAVGRQGDSGEEFFTNPNVFVAGTKAEVDHWNAQMETARTIWNNTSDDATLREELLSRFLDDPAKKGLPSSEEFALMIERNQINPDYKFETLYDREQPSIYSQLRARGVEDMSDEELSGLNTLMQTHGKMYYSPKGTQLRNWQGDDALLVDPFEMMNRSLANIAALSSFADFKQRSIEKWVKTYQNFLDLSGIPEDASPMRIFQESVFKTSMPEAQKLRNSAEAQRDTIKRILGWRSDIDREFEYVSRKMVNFVAGDKPGTIRNRVGDNIGNWVKDKNPVGAARGLAFDMKLGLFNIGQFPMQISTMFAATTIDPINGLRGMYNLPGMIGYLTKAQGEDWLELMVQRGVHTMAGFDDPDMYKMMMREAKNSGFFEIGGVHQLINTDGVNAAQSVISLPGGLGNGVARIKQIAGATWKAGRFFFNEAERWNRTVAWQIAWQRTLKGGFKVGTPAFYERLMQTANDFSWNMSQVGAARWQRGWTSIPTQFLAYQARMLEAMLGKQFTTQEKLRLVLGQAVLYGTAGVPFAAFASEMLRGNSGEAPEIGTMGGLFERGVIDTMIHMTTGVDTLYSERAGTGSFITDAFRELIGMSKYGETSFLDVMGGPLYGITKDMAAGSVTFWDSVRYMSAESGGETGLGLTAGALESLARNVSSINNAYKAYMVWNYGQYVSKNGDILLEDMPSTDAFAVALGLTPGQYRDLVAKQDWRRNRTQTISQVAEKIIAYRQRKWREPENSANIDREMQLFMGMQPEDIRIDAIRQADRSPLNKSIYEGLARRYETELNQQKFARDRQ